MTGNPSEPTVTKSLRLLTVLGIMLGLLAPFAQPTTTYAASITSAAFGGGNGTISVGNTLYAKSGVALILTVATDASARCVDVGGFAARQTSSSSKTSWSFTGIAPAGNGIKGYTITVGDNFNANACNTKVATTTASYVLDNTGPVVTGVLSPAVNAAGWNNVNAEITWSATDAGSGVTSAPTPATDSQQQNTAGVTKTATATDRLGNSGSGSVTVKLDKDAPTLNVTRSPGPNIAGWNNSDVTVGFTCSDALSGIKSCIGGGSAIVSTEGANQSRSGSATDNADNTNSAGVTGINIDKTAPTLGGQPTTAPNAAGWYKSDVAIAWNCADQPGLSGLASGCPANSTISSEGTGLTASASVSDKAGNTTNATSPAVKIDKTAPNTTATAPTDWNNTNVTVNLNANDALSGISGTFYKLDGGAQQSGTSVAISAEGVHTLEFWSVDNAGNVEATKSVQVRIDRTPPTINHIQSPAANANGWNNTNVTVTFDCGDTVSGIASCTGPQTVTTEGQNQAVTGTATDNAGNSATDPATVSIDKTAPTISGSTTPAANAHGWNNSDVTVTFACADAGSGLDGCTRAETLGEGANQSASGRAVDAAGNTADASVAGINVDKTAPILSGAATTAPNGNGWYRGDVTIDWTASDNLSGLNGNAPANSVITGEGDNLSASASVSDKAGNSTNQTVGGIKIDRTAPSTLASVPAPLESGWYAGDVLVTLTTGADLSGVAKTFYSVGSGAVQEYTGPFTFGAKGISTITFWSVDNAGNVEDKGAPGHSITLKIDGIAPTITGSRSPAANTFGWNNVPVTVSFECSDAESGIAGCSDPVTLSNAGFGQFATGNASDNAGNDAETTVENINIDLTAPTLSGAATTSPNAFGWYKGDVTVAWAGQDGLSGIDPATQPANSVITGEGANLGAGPVSISDKAGNVGSGSVSGIKIDRTAPTISGRTVNDDGTARSANAAGWFNSDVRVRFICGDALSGVQECGSDVVLSGNSANLSASGTATDNADNSASTTVSGIKIDNQAPKTDANLQCTGKNGYCRGTKATVVLAAVDQAGLSGVKEIRYSTNNGSSWQSAAGASASVDINLNGSGKASVLFYAVDNAGNSETRNGVQVKYDTIAPAVTNTLNPAPNAAGWNKADVTVTFNANDDSDGSGVEEVRIDTVVVATGTQDPKTTNLSGSKAVSGETAAAGQTLSAAAEDFAGNIGSASATVKIDKTAPTISGAIVAGTVGNNGWYTGPVTVKFTCADALSGIATCPANVVLSTDGTKQSASGTALDDAGNTASTTVTGINIDSTKPTITNLGVATGAIYTLGAVPAASCTAIDGGSGPASCSVAVTGGNTNGVGSFSFTATATDKAGNESTQTGSYRVIYKWGGFSQPINDTAHQVDQNVSIFKGGSTVPVKFQLRNAQGAVVQAGSLPQWLAPAKGSPTTATVDESVYTDLVTSGSLYRYDSTAQQYIFNWGSAKNQIGNYWRIGVKLDDGQIYYVNIGLR